MDIILFINITCTGIVFACSIITLTFGTKILATKIHGIFWFVTFLYLLFLNLEEIHQFNNIQPSQYIHFFIPVFSSLYLLTLINNKFYFKFLFIFLIPAVSFLFINIKIYHLIYHLIYWSVLIILYTQFNKFKKNETESDKKETNKKIFLGIVFNFIAVFPFIIINIIIIFFFKKEFIFQSILPPCLAFVSLTIIIISYRTSLIELDHNYYANINFLKKSIANEKKTIIEKISAGLVHEIKNPLTSILSLNQQLIEYNKRMEKNKINEYLNIMHDEVVKTKKLTESFLKSFKKDNIDNIELINLNDFFNSIIELIGYEINKNNILLTINPDLKKIKVLFNQYKLREIFLNLIFNSIEADSKKIEIYHEKNDNQLKIFIKDDGTGLSKTCSQKLFTPFFTTKTYGCGMGLFVSRDIMHDSLGNLELLSSKNEETIFCISIRI